MEAQNNPFIQAMSEDAATLKSRETNDSQVDLNSERFISKLAIFIRWFGILFSVVMIIAGIVIISDTEDNIGIVLIVVGLILLISSIIQSALLRVIANISTNLFFINKTLQEKK